MDLGHSVSIGSAEDAGLIAEVSDDLRIAAGRLDVGSEGVDLAALQLTVLDARGTRGVTPVCAPFWI
ncbi:hypothetical protein ABZ027_09755 [Streptomyces sp. NPDC006332]|uniref:hypothetical protein n=1 Tax=Streptomyces sp. NPDC006332 TaxID=3155456 RepID=UPI0033A00360